MKDKRKQARGLMGGWPALDAGPGSPPGKEMSPQGSLGTAGAAAASCRTRTPRRERLHRAPLTSQGHWSRYNRWSSPSRAQGLGHAPTSRTRTPGGLRLPAGSAPVPSAPRSAARAPPRRARRERRRRPAGPHALQRPGTAPGAARGDRRS